MKDDGGIEEEEEGLHPQDIDAYWLQRRISKACEERATPIDADKSQQLATDVFRILQVQPRSSPSFTQYFRKGHVLRSDLSP